MYFVKKSMHKKNDKESKIMQLMYNDMITKFKSEVFRRLNIMTRRYYLTYFNKDDKNRSMQKKFSNFFLMIFILRLKETSQNVLSNKKQLH